MCENVNALGGNFGTLQGSITKLEDTNAEWFHAYKYALLNLPYRISANSFRGNYSFLNLSLCIVTFGTVHTGAETIQGRKLYAEVRYIKYL